MLLNWQKHDGSGISLARQAVPWSGVEVGVVCHPLLQDDSSFSERMACRRSGKEAS